MISATARPSQAEELADLLGDTGRGDAAAFEEVYRQTAPRLFATCLRVAADRAEAEEVLQEAYLSIWRRADSFDRRRGEAMGWLVTIARNHAIDRRRAAPAGHRAIDDAAGISDTRPSALDAMTADEEERRLLDCVGALEIEGGRLLRAAYFGGMTYADVARSTDTPLGTVKTRIRRALAALRDCLG